MSACTQQNEKKQSRKDEGEGKRGEKQKVEGKEQGEREIEREWKGKERKEKSFIFIFFEHLLCGRPSPPQKKKH